jgi:hypothetical protein
LRKFAHLLIPAVQDRKTASPFGPAATSLDLKRNGKLAQATNEPACARAMPTPKKMVLPMIAPKNLLPKVAISLSINLMIGD